MTRHLVPSPDGATQVFIIIGDPVSQVKAPQLMNAVFAKSGANAAMVPIEVGPAQAPALIEALKSAGNVGGFLATIPHKFELLKHADDAGPVAIAAGCANALRREPDGRWSAENFDGIGFVTGLLGSGELLEGKTVFVYGAGGAGSSIAAGVLEAKAACVHVSDLSAYRAGELCERLERLWPGKVKHAAAGEHGDADIVVNATPVGLGETDPLPFALEGLNPEALVAEIIMKPAETHLLHEAHRRGFRTLAGMLMLQPQIDLYRRFFRIPDPDVPSDPLHAIAGRGTMP
ncbi:shikimate dehydrogenase (plasmid) [Shinella sp. H4-D48]|uniref:shikimate dehydrogenase family protein n=1 Tax=Shinella sp. H4-D48 TaxID=2925841 RepID=UPI001F52C976|nr:shikimate dehydrogenase [Shinella sp. H4-D48]UNK40111.1 shikimate dehydrogenase [Shinella sp. H4-D48]